VMKEAAAATTCVCACVVEPQKLDSFLCRSFCDENVIQYVILCSICDNMGVVSCELCSNLGTVPYDL
jgi:hypothetical protein